MTQAFQLSILTFSSKNAGQYANLWMGLLAVKGEKIHLSTFETILITGMTQKWIKLLLVLLAAFSLPTLKAQFQSKALSLMATIVALTLLFTKADWNDSRFILSNVILQHILNFNQFWRKKKHCVWACMFCVCEQVCLPVCECIYLCVFMEFGPGGPVKPDIWISWFYLWSCRYLKYFLETWVRDAFSGSVSMLQPLFLILHFTLAFPFGFILKWFLPYTYVAKIMQRLLVYLSLRFSRY